jgi:prepilin-type N-terminal cleavage/methylation domain-containing protein
MKRRNRSRAPAFTLVELLTVIAIITLLIGILVPSLSAARAQATKTAVKAQLNAIQTGCEQPVHVRRLRKRRHPEHRRRQLGSR